MFDRCVAGPLVVWGGLGSCLRKAAHLCVVCVCFIIIAPCVVFGTEIAVCDAPVGGLFCLFFAFVAVYGWYVLAIVTHALARHNIFSRASGTGAGCT